MFLLVMAEEVLVLLPTNYSPQNTFLSETGMIWVSVNITLNTKKPILVSLVSRDI